jgi:hypothetical protein
MNRAFGGPILVGKLPKPIRKIIGDLSDTKRMLFGLQLCSSKIMMRRDPER